MINMNNLCIFEGRTTKNATYSQFQGTNGPVEKVLFSISVPRALTSQQRQNIKNGNTKIKQNDFVQFSLIGGQVPVFKQYFPAGTPIKVMAHYQEYTTTDVQTGAKKYGHIFEADNISFVVSPSRQTQQAGNSGATNNNYQGQQQQGNYQRQQQSAPTSTPAQQQNNFEMFPQDEFPF